MASIRSRQASGKYLFLTAALSCANAGAQTAPGTVISNQATFEASVDGIVRRGASNVATIVVAERLDVAVGGSGEPTTIGEEATPVVATLTNTGSGEEAFALTATPSRGIHVDLIAIDRDGDGRYAEGTDQRLDGQTPVLAPGETVRLVALVTPDADPVDGTLTIAAAARTGSGDPDRVIEGMGDGGGDAVIGRTGAAADAALPLVAGSFGLESGAGLVKTQSVRAPDGSDAAVPGAIVTYTLVATLPADGARDARIEDPVPAGTTYVAGSLTLDGATLTDAADADAGGCDGRQVAVALADALADASAPRTVTFQVRLP